MKLTVAQIVEATGGILLRGDMERVVERVSTDTRVIQQDDLFVALQGPNFNGEHFVPEALLKGATGVIVARSDSAGILPDGVFAIEVADTQEALGAMANRWREMLDPTILTITGSAGKTTTKEMIAHLCEGTIHCLATEGNKNNLIGLPLTLMRLTERHACAILELGMNRPGELTALTRIAAPDVGLITNIGDAHIGNFSSLEELIRAKAEMFEAMPTTGTALVNIDCPHCAIMGEAFRIPETVISYGQNEKADIRVDQIELARPFGYKFRIRIMNEETVRVHLPVYGRYQIHNAVAAAAAAVTLGIDPAVVAARLASFQAPSMRSQVETIGGAQFIVDCYNASPTAMMEAIRSLGDLDGAGRRIAVIGDMYELGDQTEKYHRQVGIAAAKSQLDLVLAVGQSAEFVAEEANKRGVVAYTFDLPGDAGAYLHRELRDDDAVLVKGSRAMHLEDAINEVKALRSALAFIPAVESVD